LSELREDGPHRRTSNALADEAHALAGSAGLFGFERLAAMGRRFECDVQSGTGEAPDVVAGLSAALEVTLDPMIGCLGPARFVPPLGERRSRPPIGSL
jgi:HPt (histidine-containing phosphotransfer) domain-containing protein